MDSLLVDLHWYWIFTVGGFSLVDSLRVGAVAVINDLPSLVLVLVLGEAVVRLRNNGGILTIQLDRLSLVGELDNAFKSSELFCGKVLRPDFTMISGNNVILRRLDNDIDYNSMVTS